MSGKGPKRKTPAVQRAAQFERVKVDAMELAPRYGDVDEQLSRVVQRLDRWVNTATGLGTWDDKTRAARFEFPWRLTDWEITSLVSGNDLAAKVVEKRPREMFRRGYELEAVKGKDGKPSTDKSLLQELVQYGREELQIDTRVRQALTFGRQYGGSLLILGLDDGGEATEPLNEDTLKSFRFLNQVDRRFSYVLSYYSNFMSPKFGRPELYLLSNGIATSSYREIGSSGTNFGIRRTSPQKLTASNYYIQKVHESRLVRFDGVETDDITRMTLAGWSWSVLQRPYEVLRQCDQSFDSLVYLLSDASQGVLKLKGLINAIAGGNQGKLQTRLETIDKMRSVLRTMAVDADSEDFERKATPLTGIPDAIDRIMQRFAAAADMPLTEVFGMSPAGLNATGESDRIKWYDTIANEQTNDLGPVLRRIYKLAAKAKESPFKGRDIDFKIHFAPLYAPTDEELSKTRLNNAQRDQIYIEAAVIQPEKVGLTLTDVYPSIDPEELEEEIQAKTQFNPYENEPPKPAPPQLTNGQPNPVSAKMDIPEAPSTAVPRPGSPEPLGTPSDGKPKAKPPGKRADWIGRFGDRADAVPLPDGEEIAQAVYAQLSDDYEPAAIAWIKQRRYVKKWIGPIRVPIEKLDMSGREQWRASHEPAKVECHVNNILNGREKPVVLSCAPKAELFKILDGHHRSLGAEELGSPVVAWIAYVQREAGPWDEMHGRQKEGGTTASDQMLVSRQLCSTQLTSKQGGVDWHSSLQTLHSDFDPDQPRDEHGRWSQGGGAAASSAASAAPTGAAQGGHVREAIRSAVQKIRGAPAAIGRAALHEVKKTIADFKGAAPGLKNFFTGHEVTHEQKKALAHVAVSVAAGIVASYVTPFLPIGRLVGEGAAKVGEKIADQVAHHVIEHLANRGLHLDARVTVGWHLDAANPEEWFATEIALAVADALERLPESRADFDPDQPRDEKGRWGQGGGSSVSTTKGAESAPAAPYPSGTAAGVIHEAHAGDFRASFENAFETSPFTNHVSHYSEEDLGHMRTFLSADGKAGIAVHDHGDGRIEGTALFNQGARKGAGAALLRHAIDNAGVNYLECYGEGLRKLYESAGFKVESTSPFNADYASKTWDYARFDHPNYYTLRLGGSGKPTSAPSGGGSKQERVQPLFSGDSHVHLGDRITQPTHDKDSTFKAARVAFDDQLGKLDHGEGLDKAIGARVIRKDQGEAVDLSKKGPVIVIGGLKSEVRASEKVETDYHGDWSRVGDIVRSTVAVDSYKELPGVLDKLKASGVDLARAPKDRFTAPTEAGYRDAVLNVRYANGHVGEIQLQVKPILAVKPEAHKLYETVRGVDATMKREGRTTMTEAEMRTVDDANAASRELMAKAWSKANE